MAWLSRSGDSFCTGAKINFKTFTHTKSLNCLVFWQHLEVYEYITTYLMSSNHPTPYSRVFLEKLMVPQLVKKFPTLCETRKRFITVFTRAHHIQMNPVHTIPTSFSKIHFNIFFSHLCLVLPTGLIPSGFPTKILYAFLFSPMHDGRNAGRTEK